MEAMASFLPPGPTRALSELSICPMESAMAEYAEEAT